MASISSTSFSQFPLILLAISFHISYSSAARYLAQTTSTEFVRTSCSTTTYPNLCYTSLSVHANKIHTSPKLLASAALTVTLESAKSTLFTMQKLSQDHGMKPREASAMEDCMELLIDSADEIGNSIDHLGKAKGSNFKLMINDVQTWVSAALTDESTCSEGFVGNKMNGQLKTLAHLTSNALSLVNNYASLHG